MTRFDGCPNRWDLLEQIQGNLLHFTDSPEALEWHQSVNVRADLGRV